MSCSYFMNRYTPRETQPIVPERPENTSDDTPRTGRQSPETEVSSRSSRTYRNRDTEPSHDSPHQRSYSKEHTPKRSAYHKALVPVAIVIVAVAVFALMYLPSRVFAVEINGASHELQGSHTIASLLEEGVVDAQPGDLVAVDGSVLEVGKGEPFSAVINGEITTNPQKRVSEGDHIAINDGKDTREPADETTEIVPWQLIEEGVGPLHVFEGKPADGMIRVLKGKISGIEFREEIPPQHLVYRKYFPDVGDEKVIALTFDDGPWPGSTQAVLNILTLYRVKATFFTLGEQIDAREGSRKLVERAAREGHQICTHSYDHAKGKGKGADVGLMPPEQQIAEITRGYEEIEKVLGGKASRVVRMPGGNFHTESQKILHPYLDAEIGWTVDSLDWKKLGSDAIVEAMLTVQPGGVILLHDGGGDRKQTVDALKRAIPALKEQGYRFVTIDELLKYPPAQ